MVPIMKVRRQLGELVTGLHHVGFKSQTQSCEAWQEGPYLLGHLAYLELTPLRHDVL